MKKRKFRRGTLKDLKELGIPGDVMVVTPISKKPPPPKEPPKE